MSAQTFPAWKRRRYERLGLPLPEVPRKLSQPAAEHSASSSVLRELGRIERERDD